MSSPWRSPARLLSVALVLAATLPPQGAGGGDPLPFLCLVCGPTGTAELLLNAALFLPLGLAVARPGEAGPGAAAALAWGLALSAGVEAAQTVVPGRYPALGDLAANAAGAGAGGLLAVTSPAWLRPSPAASGRMAAAWGAVVAAAALATGALLAPSLPPSAWWVQRAPELGHLEHFPGRVLTARSGDAELPAGRMSTADRRRLAGRLAAGPELAATVRSGPDTDGLAPILSVFDGREREIFLLGQDGRDLVFRLRRRAADAGLYAPAHRAAGLLEGSRPGDTLALGVRPDTAAPAAWPPGGGKAGLCLRAGDARRCGLGFRVGRGWTLLAGIDVPPALARWLDGAWIALMFLPLGFWTRAGPGRARVRAGWLVGLAAAAGGLLAAPAAGPLLGAGAAELLGAGAGLAAGVLAHRWVGTASPEARGPGPGRTGPPGRPEGDPPEPSDPSGPAGGREDPQSPSPASSSP